MISVVATSCLLAVSILPTASPSSGWSVPCSPSRNDEWIEQRRYFVLEVLAKSRLRLVDATSVRR